MQKLIIFGRAKQIKVNKDNTVIIDGEGDSKEIENRIISLKSQIENTLSEFEKEELEERLSKIVGGVAVIEVGAATEIEMQEKKLRIEDALSATKAATIDGIVAGGGTALINIKNNVEEILKDLEDSEKIGAKIVIKALEEPLKQIALNAGLEPAVIIEKVKSSNKGIGFDAEKEEFVDMKKAGIIDPTKVTISALENAVSISSMILTTESLLANTKEKKHYVIDQNESVVDNFI